MTLPMIIPSGGKHVRQVEFRIEPKFIGTPDVTASIYSNDSNGTMFGLWSIVCNDLGTQTQIVVSATNTQVGIPSDFNYICSIIAIGKTQ